MLVASFDLCYFFIRNKTGPSSWYIQSSSEHQSGAAAGEGQGYLAGRFSDFDFHCKDVQGK